MSCNNPNSKCLDPVPSNCVQWQGAEIPVLSICPGDSITEVETAIIDKLITVLDGSGIDLSSLDYKCLLATVAGKDKNLAFIIQTLIDQNCSLSSLITSIQNQINQPETYNLGSCFGSEIPTNNTHDLVQELVYKICFITDQLNSVTNDITGGSLANTIDARIGNFIQNRISGTAGPNGYGVTSSGSGPNASITIIGLIPPFCPIPCTAPLSFFDSTGKGNAGTAFAGYYICNGLNSTPDLRGYTFAGATVLNGINGPVLDSRVNAADHGNNPEYNSFPFYKKGNQEVQLSVAHLPSHSHNYTDPGHVHLQTAGGAYGVNGGSGQNVPILLTPENTKGSTVNITISNTGGNQPFDNRQPTFYGYYIMRIN